MAAVTHLALLGVKIWETALWVLGEDMFHVLFSYTYLEQELSLQQYVFVKGEVIFWKKTAADRGEGVYENKNLDLCDHTGTCLSDCS